MKPKLKFILIGLGIYLMSTGVSFAVFSSSKSGGSVSPLSGGQGGDAGQMGEMMVFTGPRDQECPLNGAMYTKEQKKIWEERRPLTVMIENHEDARPQSGYSRADVVYEAVAEGGITRTLGVFYCKATEPYAKKYDLGPVRSARTYFLDWASEYGDYPLYVHVGGAHCSEEGGVCTTNSKAQALEQINKYGWVSQDHHNDMNQFALGYKECRREPERTGESRATEHTMYCDTDALWTLAEERELTNVDSQGDSWDEGFVSWSFKDDAKEGGRGNVNDIKFDFWEGYKDYAVEWTYDSTTNSYKRFNGGQEHKDFLNDQQIMAKVVVVQFAKETGPVDVHKHMLYGTTGTGKAIVFQDGQAISVNWSKDDRQSRTIFTDSKGKEIEFNRGLIWIEVLPQGNEVDYEPSS